MEKRLQGRTDVSLNASGQAQLAGRRVPTAVRGFACHTSPLRRARETAQLLELSNPIVEPALIEMSWGAWEGRRTPELRAFLGDELRRREALGLDFRPPGGESPRDVQRRLRPWLEKICCQRDEVLAVTHKGVMRALLALATGWDMCGKSPIAVDWTCVQLLSLQGSCTLSLLQLNVPLEVSGGHDLRADSGVPEA